jgi:predicted methyltransferase
MSSIFLIAVAITIVLAGLVSAQAYDYATQAADIQRMQEDLVARQRALDNESSFEQRNKLQEQQFRLQEMDRRNREAETNWIFDGDKRH